MTPSIAKNPLMPQEEINLEITSKFLNTLGEDQKFTFQIFDDKKGNPQRAKILHGDLESVEQELVDANLKGAGIFVTINATDLQGRTAGNITKVRAFVLDLDGAPLQSVDAAVITPHIVVETSPGRYHVYWLVEDVPLEAFTLVQKQLAKIYGGDPQVCDLSRVMRLPGFLHQKRSPFMTNIVSMSVEQPIKFQDFISAFGIDLSTKREANTSNTSHNSILSALEAQGIVIERKRQPQGCIVIKCPWSHLHSADDKGTCYYEPNTNGYTGHGFKCFHSHCAEKTIDDLKGFLGIQTHEQIKFSEDPMPLNEKLLPVAQFTYDMLPEVLRPWVMDCSERMQVPADFLAISIVVVLASLVGRKVGIHPKAQDDWLVVPNLWGAVVGRPSLLKSPSIFEALKFLENLDALAGEKFASEKFEYEREQLWIDAQKSMQKEAYRVAAKKGTKKPSLETIEEPLQPILKRYRTEDSTTEKLGEILKDNPQGILLHRDELVGWLKSLDKQGREGDRAFFLESWNGNGSFTVDRISRGTLHIPAICLSILGSIQPGPLASYVNQALIEGAGDDGLIQRFQLLVWPDASSDWINIDRPPDKDAKEKIGRVFRAVDAFGPFEPSLTHIHKNNGCASGPFEPSMNRVFEPIAFRFSPSAQKIFNDWREELESFLRCGELTPALESHLAKYRSLMPSLALIFYLVQTVGNDEDPFEVDANSTELAIKWCKYLETHARRLYASAESPGMESARALLAKVENGELLAKLTRDNRDFSDGFSFRDVYHGSHWAHLETAEKVAKAVKILEEFGWVIVQDSQRQDKLGRQSKPSTKVYVHPSIRSKS